MSENYTEIFYEIAYQVESISDGKVKYHKDIMGIKIKTNDDLVFNKMINIPVCVIIVSSIFKENERYYPHISLHDCFYEKEISLEEI